MKSADIFIQNIEKLKQKGNYQSALKIALEWLNTYMDDYRFYEELADIYIFEENIDKAEEVIRYARELHPWSWTGLFLEWYIFLEKWEFEKALHLLEKANKMFPNKAEIIQNIGWCHVMLGSIQKWIALLRRAQQLDPDDMSITHKLSTALMFYEDHISSHS